MRHSGLLVSWFAVVTLAAPGAPLQGQVRLASPDGRSQVTVEIRENEWKDHLDRIVRSPKGDYQACLLGWMADMPDPNDFLYVQFDSQNADLSRAHQNIALYKNPVLDDLVERAQRLSDREQRAALYRQAQTLLRDEVPLIPIAHGFVALGARRRVHGLEVNVVSSNYGLENVWLEGAAPANHP